MMEMMAIRITVGVLVVAAISAWAYYIDNKLIAKEDDAEEEGKADKK